MYVFMCVPRVSPVSAGIVIILQFLDNPIAWHHLPLLPSTATEYRVSWNIFPVKFSVVVCYSYNLI